MDKITPLIITIIIAPIMDPGEFGLWVLFFQFIIFGGAIVGPTQNTNYSRDFYKNNYNKIFVYNPFQILLVLVLIFIISVNFFETIMYSFIIVSSIIANTLFVKLCTYYRFSNNDKLYVLVSFLKAFTFILCLFLSGEINVLNLIISYTFSLVPGLIFSFFKLSFRFKKVKLNIFIMLLIYGTIMGFNSSADRYIIEHVTSISYVGYYSFLLSVAYLPSYLIEVLKQLYNPYVYNELSFNNTIRFNKNLILLISFVVSILQLIAPTIFIFLFLKFDYINTGYIILGDIYLDIFILSCGLIFYNFYHFLNPIIFYFKKEKFLNLFQLISFFYFSIMIFIDIDNIFFHKSISVVILTLCSLFYLITLNNKFHVKQI